MKSKTNHYFSTFIIHTLYRGNSQLIHAYFLLNFPYGKSESPKRPPACMSISGLNAGPLLFQACTPKPAPCQFFSLLAHIPLPVVLSPPYSIELVGRAWVQQVRKALAEVPSIRPQPVTHQNSSLRQSYKLQIPGKFCCLLLPLPRHEKDVPIIYRTKQHS